MNRSLLPVAMASAAIGCGASVALVEGFHLGGGKTTTVVEQGPLSSASDASTSSNALTARDIYKRDAPGVVFIKADVVQKSQSTSPFDFGLPQEQRGTATGSGFVIDKNGTILTNAHVVNGATRITVQFQNKQTATATVRGTDESTDLAVLKVDPAGQKLTPLVLGSSKTVQVGDPAIAIGNPFGLERTLTTGVISAVQRTIQAPNNFQINDVLQTDAPINPGNSGGPLIDSSGRVIGINSQIETGSSGGGNVGIGFAVPIDTAKQIIPQLEKAGRVDRGFLGVSTVTIDKTLKGLNLPVAHGALVESVTPGSPAAKAGVKGGTISASLNGSPIQLGGDVITKIDGSPIRSDNDVVQAIAGRKGGDKVKVTVMRGSKTLNLTVTLSERPSSLPGSP